MEVITIESKAFNEIIRHIVDISNFLNDVENRINEFETHMKDIAVFTKQYCKDEDWVDEKTICDYLDISTRTLQRLRKKEMLNFSMTTGKPRYTVGEVRRMLREGLVREMEFWRQYGITADILKAYKVIK